MFKEWIEYDNPKMLEEAMRKENFCYDQKKREIENVSTWKNKRTNNYDPKKKQNKDSGNNYKGYQGNNYKNFKPQNSIVKEPSNVPNKNSAHREPLKSWVCGGLHYLKDFLVRKNNFNVHSIQESCHRW